MPFSPIPEILDDLRAGKMIVLVDDPNRENEGDLVVAAQFATPETINFMITHARGQVCLSMSEDRADELELPLQTPYNTSAFGTAFTISIDSRHDITTGISPHDRSHTILTAAAEDARPADLARPGHVFPLRARNGGVLVRTGQTEGSVDLCSLGELRPMAVICEVLAEDGHAMRVPGLEVFCEKHEMKMCSIADIIEYRRHEERLIRKLALAKLPTVYGDFDVHVYESALDNAEHVAVTMGLDVVDGDDGAEEIEEPILVRVHSECLTGDVFFSARCDCGQQLATALKMVGEEGRGVILYMRQEGRGIGLSNKIKAYALQDGGLDTVEANEKLGFGADERNYGIGAQILFDLGIRSMRLMTNNPKKYLGLEGYGLSIEERVQIECAATETNLRYLEAKRDKLGHLISVPRPTE
jgi:3,4-dihydroxy 2-butanone 4-phosphate synthase / GTP cyclohydrolase II